MISSFFFSLLSEPFPLRRLARKLLRRFGWGTYLQRLTLGAVARPHYGYCLYQAAVLAHKLGLPRISAAEFGVAGGKGLLNLEEHARHIEALLPVKIEIYGFDSGLGMPEPQDYRDMPYLFQRGFYKMDLPALQARLERSHLIIGPVQETAPAFAETLPQAAPFGALFFDLDFYSSTFAVLRLFEAPLQRFLPRIFCYFDDIIGGTTQLYSDFTGERLALKEFNEQHEDIKFSPAYHLLAARVVESWYHRIQIAHLFQHPQYGQFVSAEEEDFFRL